jgi:hypothetical protein
MGDGEELSLEDAYRMSQRMALEGGDVNEALNIEGKLQSMESSKALERNRKLKEISVIASVDPELARQMWDAENLGGNPSFIKPEKAAKPLKDNPTMYYHPDGRTKIINANDPAEKRATLEDGFTTSEPKQGSNFQKELNKTRTEKESRLGASREPSIADKVASGVLGMGNQGYEVKTLKSGERVKVKRQPDGSYKEVP